MDDLRLVGSSSCKEYETASEMVLWMIAELEGLHRIMQNTSRQNQNADNMMNEIMDEIVSTGIAFLNVNNYAPREIRKR